MSGDIKQLDDIIRHIQLVHENCIILGKRLLEEGQPFLGRMLIYNGFQHDVSKFIGSEWEHMKFVDVKKLNKEQKICLKTAIEDHNHSNQHHPEFWESIHKMPEVYLAEMVCDWKARSNEFGTSLEDWVNEQASKRFGFDKNDEVYKKIKYFMDLLCHPPFGEVK